MQRVHFIAIGGAAMHNLAIAISKKNSFLVTGSDDEIYDPSFTRLKNRGLLPDKLGWFPDRIHKGLSAVIVGTHVASDNPELVQAKALGLKVYSYPEFLFQQTRSKTRIVVGGSHGKSTTTAIILYVLKQLRIDADYMVGAHIDGFDALAKLSYEARIAVFEGDEYLTSSLDPRPKFHLYKPHIAVLTGIAWDHIDVFPSEEEYVEQFRRFTELMEVQGRLIYFADDKHLKQIAEKLRRDIVPFTYNTPEYEVHKGVTYLKTKKADVALSVFGEHNLQNIEAARIACRQIGVTDDQFYSVIPGFGGAATRLQRIADSDKTIIYRDYAHSPSKLRATLKAVRGQYPDKKIIACFELNTYSSLSAEYILRYADTTRHADIALIYYDPEELKRKGLKDLNPEDVKLAFGPANVEVLTDKLLFETRLKEMDYAGSVVLLMSSGNFSGIDVEKILKDKI
ncbi:MAG: Mur ligase middle domain protein [Bacteroidetes bacterium]|nr:Mur ligase middle domain protein [Bacteroidota bacterium]